MVCVCDSNLRKFLVEISDTVGLDRLVLNWLEFIFCVFDDQVYGYLDLFLFFMDDQVCDFLGTYLSFACWIIFSKYLIEHPFGCRGEKKSGAQLNGSSISCEGSF